MISFVVGKGLSGKTYHVKEWLASQKKPYIALDTLKEYPVDTRFENIDTFLDSMVLNEGSHDFGNIGLTLATIDDGKEFFAWAWHLRPHILVAEEFHQYSNSWDMPKAVQRIFRLGRHRGIDLIGVTHRFGDMHQLARGQAQVIVFFQQDGDRDIDAIAKLAGKEIAYKVANLQPREHIIYRL